MKHNDLSGRRFGKLLVLHRVENRNKHICYLCHCDCGKEKVIQGNHLVEGSTTSCGSCYDAHNTRLYRSVWIGIKQRCYNPNCKDYSRYGGRGIKICDEWLNDFCVFQEWAYMNGYDDKAPKGQCTLDRRDVNGDYCPENCRWISIAEQNANKTTNHLITFREETHTIAEWARITGISESALYNRINRNWELERAFTQLARKGGDVNETRN